MYIDERLHNAFLSVEVACSRLTIFDLLLFSGLWQFSGLHYSLSSCAIFLWCRTALDHKNAVFLQTIIDTILWADTSRHVLLYIFTITPTVNTFLFVLPMSVSRTNKIVIYFIVYNTLLLKELSTFYDLYLHDVMKIFSQQSETNCQWKSLFHWHSMKTAAWRMIEHNIEIYVLVKINVLVWITGPFELLAFIPVRRTWTLYGEARFHQSYWKPWNKKMLIELYLRRWKLTRFMFVSKFAVRYIDL